MVNILRPKRIEAGPRRRPGWDPKLILKQIGLMQLVFYVVNITLNLLLAAVVESRDITVVTAIFDAEQIRLDNANGW